MYMVFRFGKGVRNFLSPINSPDRHLTIKEIPNNQPNFAHEYCVGLKKALNKELGRVRGYIEWERVSYLDFGFLNELEAVPEDLFEDVIDSHPVMLNPNSNHVEFHWTVPASLIGRNLELFCSSGMQLAYINKGGVQCAILTGIFNNMQQCSRIFDKIAKLKYGNIKREVKKIYGDESIYFWPKSQLIILNNKR
jgi:hypothetical protein